MIKAYAITVYTIYPTKTGTGKSKFIERIFTNRAELERFMCDVWGKEWRNEKDIDYEIEERWFDKDGFEYRGHL